MSNKTMGELFFNYSDVKFDSSTASDVIVFLQKFMRRNEEHINFFSGNLLGVNKVIWSPADTSYWMENICKIYDYTSLHEDIFELSGIKKSWKVSTEPINQSFIFMIHGFHDSNLTAEQKTKVMVACMNLLQIKFLTAINHSFFKYGADINISTAMYESLSKKSLLKKYQNWGNLIQARSEYLVSKNSPHYDVIRDYKDTEGPVDFVNDVRGRVKNGLKNLTGKFMDLKSAEARIGSYGSLTEVDGKVSVREYQRSVDGFIIRFAGIVEDPADFIRKDLMGITLELINTASENNLKAGLMYISQHVKVGKTAKMDLMKDINDFSAYIFSFIRTTNLNEKDLSTIALNLRAVFRSHKVGDEKLNKFKNSMDKVVDMTVTANHAATRSATKVALQMYIALRILTIKYYN